MLFHSTKRYLIISLSTSFFQFHSLTLLFLSYASSLKPLGKKKYVNSSGAQPPPPPPPPPPLGQADPSFQLFFALDGKFSWVGTLELSNPPGWGQKKRANARPPSTLQHFSLIAQSKSAVLNILMCDFLFRVTSSFVIALGL